MKEKKGFTLVELLVVIVVLGIILLIAIPAVSRYLKRGTAEYYSNLEKTVVLSGRDYLNDYRALLPKEINNVTVIELKELVNNRYIDPVVDSEGKECTARIAAKKTGNKEYEYYGCLICDNYQTEGEACSLDENNNVTVETKNYLVEVDKTGDYEIDANGVYIVQQGDNFEVPYAKAYYKLGETKELISDRVIGNPRIIDTNKAGITKVVYVYKGARAEITVKVIDRTKPGAPQVVLRKDSQNGKVYSGGWYSGNIYEEFKSTDYSKPGVVGSGIARYEISSDGEIFSALAGNYHVSTENGAQSYYVRSIDKNGNASEAQIYSLKIDKEVPTCELTSSGTLGNSGWYISDATINFNKITEEVSGIEIQEIDSPNITSDVKNKKITGTVTDKAGNTDKCYTIVNVDKTNPTVNYNVIGGVYNSNKEVKVTANDAYFSYMDIQVNKNGLVSAQNNNITSNTKTYTLTDGSWTIYTKAYDESGRKQSQAPENEHGWYYQSYTIDTRVPTCSLRVTSGTLGNNGWYTSNVTVGFNSTDGTGSELVVATLNRTSVTNEGTTRVVGTVTDTAGNTGTCSIDIKIDKTKPGCSFAGENNSWTSSSKTITATCNDSASGCTSVTASKSWLYTSGTTSTASLSYIIEDNAGNSNTCSKAVNVYVDKEGPTTPTGGAIGAVSGTNTTGSVQTAASGSTDSGVGGVTYKYIIKANSTTPSANDGGFTTSRNFTRSCGTTYHAWAVAEDGLGNRSGVRYLGTTSDGVNSYSNWSSCSATCGGGTQTRTNTCALVTTGLSQSCNAQSCCDYAVGHSWTFSYRGSTEEFNIPCSGTYMLIAYGGEGGNSGSGFGGAGGRTTISLWAPQGEKLYICVGGAGLPDGTGGYNGGGTGRGHSGADVPGGGGGATHISLTNRGELKNFENYKNEVIIVAGGGGGAGKDVVSGDVYEDGADVFNALHSGGDGGGLEGGHGYGCSGYALGGGQSYRSNDGRMNTPGTFGQGGSGYTHLPDEAMAGGGGGWYGGESGSHHRSNSGAGGGSGYFVPFYRGATMGNFIIAERGFTHAGMNVSCDGKVIIRLTHIGDY